MKRAKRVLKTSNKKRQASEISATARSESYSNRHPHWEDPRCLSNPRNFPPPSLSFESSGVEGCQFASVESRSSRGYTPPGTRQSFEGPQQTVSSDRSRCICNKATPKFPLEFSAFFDSLRFKGRVFLDTKTTNPSGMSVL